MYVALPLSWAIFASGVARGEGSDTSRAVIAVFQIRASDVPDLDDATLEHLTGNLHAVIATGSGFLTVPRAAIRKALEQSSGLAEGTTLGELAAEADKLEAEAKKARERAEGLVDAKEIVPDSQLDKARALIEEARAEAVERAAIAKAARRQFEEAEARALS